MDIAEEVNARSGVKNLKIKLSKQGLILSFPSQNDKKNFPAGCT